MCRMPASTSGFNWTEVEPRRSEMMGEKGTMIQKQRR